MLYTRISNCNTATLQQRTFWGMKLESRNPPQKKM